MTTTKDEMDFPTDPRVIALNAAALVTSAGRNTSNIPSAEGVILMAKKFEVYLLDEEK